MDLSLDEPVRTRGKIYSALHHGEATSDQVTVDSVKIADDGKTATLEIPTLRQDLAEVSLGQLPGLPDMIDTPIGLILASITSCALRMARKDLSNSIRRSTMSQATKQQSSMTALNIIP